MAFPPNMTDKSAFSDEVSRRAAGFSTDGDVDNAYDADVEAAADVDSMNDSPSRPLHGDSESDSSYLPDSERDALASPSRAAEAAAAAEKAKALEGDAELDAEGGKGGKEKGKGEAGGKGEEEGAGKGKRRRCGRWEVICWVGIGAGVVMTAVGLTMLVFFLSLTQQEPVVTIEGIDIARFSISIPPQTIKMPNLDPSMVSVPNLGGIQANVPSLGSVPDLDIPSLDLSNLDLKNPKSLGKSLRDRLSNFGKDVSNFGKDVSAIGKNVTKEVSKVGKNVSKEVSTDLSRIRDEIQAAIADNFAGLRVDLNAHVNVTASIYNPNSFEGVFNFLDMGIYLFGIHVSNVSLPAFELGKKQTKTATVPLVIKSFPLLSTSSSGQVRSPIATALRERKIKMQTFINTQGKVKVWGISSPTYNVSVMCIMTVDPRGERTTTQECGAKPTQV